VKYGRTVVVNNMDGEEFPLLVHVVAVKESCCYSLEACLNTCPATEACKGPHLNNVRVIQILGAEKFKLSST
jgi:epoxyqueuosine reductase QueG